MSTYQDEEREYTDEGEMLSNAIMGYYNLMNVVPSAKVKEPVDKRSKEAKMLDAIRLQLLTMICNSELVIEDCDKILADVKDMEAYMSCDAKAAKTVHQNFIIRVQRILDGLPAFEKELEIVQKRLKEKLLLLSLKK